MLKTNPLRFSFVTLMILLFASRAISAQNTAFTYQGKLTDNGNAGNGTYEMQFRLYDTATVGTGTQQGATITNTTVEVSGGIFTVLLDFGAGVFDGSARYLEVSVRPGGSPGPYVVLAPRQSITSSPYSIRSLNAVQLGGIAAGGYIQNSTAQQTATNFNISGNGTAAGTLSGTAVNAAAQYNLAGSRVLAGTINNLFVGINAGAANTTGAGNSFFGPSAGFSNQTGQYNSFFGHNAGLNNTDNFNSFFGSDAGRDNTGGFANSFFGASAGQVNTVGEQNAFFGVVVGSSNTTGSFNSFFGAQAGSSNTVGSNNNFFGVGAGYFNTSGNRNAFFGSNAGFGNISGTDNTFVGQSAGVTNTVGDFNTFVGSQASGMPGISNATAIGAGALVTQSNSLVLGNGVNVGIGTGSPDRSLTVERNGGAYLNARDRSGPFEVLVGADAAGGIISTMTNHDLQLRAGGNIVKMVIKADGSVGIGTAFPADKLHVDGDIRIGTGGNGCVRSSNGTVIAGACSSDRRFKTWITPFSNTLDKLVRLQPVNFYWRAKEYPEKGFGNELSFGLVAQDVEPVMPELVAEDEKGFKLVRYHKLPFVMLQAIKDLRAEKDAEVEALKFENAALKEQNTDFEARLRILEAKLKTRKTHKRAMPIDKTRVCPRSPKTN